MIFTELLERGNFRAGVEALAMEFRKKHGLPPIRQLGLVTPSVEDAAAELEARGIGPFFIAAGAPVRWTERGDERRFAGKLGMAIHEGFELELLEPGEGSDFYRRSLDPEGRIVVQHLGLLTDDVDGEAGDLARKGWPVYVRGTIKSGPLRTEFCYMDTEKEAGLVIEFIDWTFFGLRFTPPAFIYHGLGRLEKLIHKRSLSM